MTLSSKGVGSAANPQSHYSGCRAGYPVSACNQGHAEGNAAHR